MFRYGAMVVRLYFWGCHAVEMISTIEVFRFKTFVVSCENVLITQEGSHCNSYKGNFSFITTFVVYFVRTCLKTCNFQVKETNNFLKLWKRTIDSQQNISCKLYWRSGQIVSILVKCLLLLHCQKPNKLKFPR